MTKKLIIGMSTLAIVGTGLITAGVYAASGTMNQTHQNHMQMQDRNPQNLIQTLSGKVSPEALTALQTLMTQHQSEMDALRSNTGTTKEALKANHEAWKTQMDALITKYPELKNALPQHDKMQGRQDIDQILSGVSDADKVVLKSLRDAYQTKHEALMKEEKTKADAILSKYPDIKAQLDTTEKQLPMMKGMGHRDR